MAQKSYEVINSIVGFDAFDKKGRLIRDTRNDLLRKIGALLEKPDQNLRENLDNLVFTLYSICNEEGIYPSSLMPLNKAQAFDEAYASISIPILDVSNFESKDFKIVFNSLDSLANHLLAFSFNLAILTSESLKIQLARLVSFVILNKMAGPLFLNADGLQFDAKNFENDREFLLEDLKKKTRAAIRLGIYNIHYDSSELKDEESNRIMEKMLMNLKMVAMATNLWVRNFQPNSISVSVSGKMGLANDDLPKEGELKEYVQRLLKEGSRLRFGVAGDDVSVIEIPIPNLSDATIEKVNQLNYYCRRDLKLSGVLVDIGSIQNEKEINVLNKIRTCEVKFSIVKNNINSINLKALISALNKEKQKIELYKFSSETIQIPKLEEISY